MSRNRTLTNGKKPNADCPICAKPVVKAVMYGQLSYNCGTHWGPWDDRIKRVEKQNG